MSKTILIIFSIVLYSCKSIDFTGHYVQCEWNCTELLIHTDGTFTEMINPEIGAGITIKGTYIQSGKYLVLTPFIDKHISFDSSVQKYVYIEPDSISKNDTTPPFEKVKNMRHVYTCEYLSQQYKIKRNRLRIVSIGDDNNKSRMCDFVKLSHDSSKNERAIRNNRIDCNTKNSLLRIFY